MSKERVYAILTSEEERSVAKLAGEGVSQQHIALKLKIAKQSISTFLRKAGLGKRRVYVPVSDKIRCGGDKKGVQLHFYATFQNEKTGKIQGNIHCFSKVDYKYNYGKMKAEAIAHGQKLCTGDRYYEESNEVWIPIYIYKEYKIIWEVKD